MRGPSRDPSHYAVILKLAFELDINEPWTDRVEVLENAVRGAPDL
jgi:hypothetical protein